MVAVRCVRAIFDPRAGMVQMAVKNCLLSLIVIDAAVVLAMAGRFWACMSCVLLCRPCFWAAGSRRPEVGSKGTRRRCQTAPGLITLGVAVDAKRLQVDRHRLGPRSNGS